MTPEEAYEAGFPSWHGPPVMCQVGDAVYLGVIYPVQEEFHYLDENDEPQVAYEYAIQRGE